MPQLKYELNDGGIARVRVSLDKVPLVGAEPAGGRTVDYFVEVTGSTRKRTGTRARRAVYSRNSGTATNPTIRTVTIPFLTQAEFVTAPDSISYKGFTWALTNTKGEDN